MISVIIPCFNEEAVIESTHRRLLQVLQKQSDIDFELIYVDDCSDDLTLAKLKEIQSFDACVRVLSLSRNFGQHVAVTAGLENSVGDAAVIIDADLQDSPEVILEMLQRWRSGVDVAYGVRQEREGETRFKLWTAKAFYRVFNHVSDFPVPSDTGYFRLMDRRVVEAFLSMPERDRFIHGMVSWVGFRQEPVGYRRERRSAGTTKYHLGKMLGVALNGIVSFSTVPLRLAAWFGLVASSLAILGIVYALVLRLATQIWVPGWTLLFIAVLFLGGTQLIFLGVIGEYIGRIYGEVKRRPLYFVKERLGFPTADVRMRVSAVHSALP
ncbi:MAG: glycosyltransferase family 2 protein [Candidatus Binatia bacterium]